MRIFWSSLLMVITFIGVIAAVLLIVGEGFGLWPRHDFWPWIQILWGFGSGSGFVSARRDLKEAIEANRGPRWEI